MQAGGTPVGRTVTGPGPKMSPPRDDDIQFATIPEAIEAIANGEIVVVMDDEDRENEGDLVLAAEMATEAKIALIVNHTTGILCAPMTTERALELELPPMCFTNQDPKGTAFTVSTDAVGTGTGVSANDRATTFRRLANTSFQASHFLRLVTCFLWSPDPVVSWSVADILKPLLICVDWLD